MALTANTAPSVNFTHCSGNAATTTPATSASSLRKKSSAGDSAPAPAAGAKTSARRSPDLSYLPKFNDVGGRPDERRGTHGSFAPGVRILPGGPARNVPLAKIDINQGDNNNKVLFVSSIHKPELSGEARTNAIRPNERLGSRGGFTPGAKCFLGGASCDIPLKATTADHGTVLFVSAIHKPDMSCAGRTNRVRPTERLGSGGRFTPGARRWLGGKPRDIPLEKLRDPGTVIFESTTLKADLSGEGETNVSGGRGDERQGRLGSFEHGVVEVAGGPLHMPAPGEEVLWQEAGQKKENRFRRCAPSHFVAGVSILSGGMPVY
eukprot:jgi/Undpi1/1123/HiC_scaffold_10.g04585.m1